MTFHRFLVLGLLLAAQLQSSFGNESGKRAAYFINNDVAGNNVVSLTIDPNTGLLSSPVLTPTGGKGRLGNSQTGGAAGPDTLFTQDSVVVDGNYLFVVNPGSNTLSLLYIPDDDPTHPTLVGEPADTLGEFPVSVAYSAKLEIACVLNGGAIAGVTCYSVDSKDGLKPLDKSPRSIAKHLNQTTPPVGPFSTVSDILFNPSSTALFVIIKGTPTPTPAIPGAFYVYPVVDGLVSTDPVISTPARLIVDFGSAFLGRDDRLFVSDASYGASIVNVSSDWVVTEAINTTIPNFGAPCWAVYSSEFESVYVTDAARNNITIFDPNSAAIKGYVNFPATAAGAFDGQIDRNWFYILSADPAILVLKLDSDVGKLQGVQKIDLSALGSRQAWEGLAIYH